MKVVCLVGEDQEKSPQSKEAAPPQVVLGYWGQGAGLSKVGSDTRFLCGEHLAKVVLDLRARNSRARRAE